jgi:hypothetical protein
MPQGGQQASTPHSSTDTVPDAPCAPQERYYLRSLGTNPRKEPAHLGATFPELAADVTLPPLLPPDALFSTVLRISSPGLRLWTHFVSGQNVTKVVHMMSLPQLVSLRAGCKTW